MKLINHLFGGIGDYILLSAWAITLIISFYFSDIWPLTIMFTIFMGIWLWMGIHFWREENKMFDRFERQMKADRFERRHMLASIRVDEKIMNGEIKTIADIHNEYYGEEVEI